jgi:hypothetical protein
VPDADARRRDHDLGGAVPEREAQMSAFGFVMHNFFIFFNATIGLCFLHRARRELLGASH